MAQIVDVCRLCDGLIPFVSLGQKQGRGQGYKEQRQSGLKKTAQAATARSARKT